MDCNVARIEFDSVTSVIFEVFLIEWALWPSDDNQLVSDVPTCS